MCDLSLPVRERGLKLCTLCAVAGRGTSLPVRERGLKHYCRHEQDVCQGRSPCGSVD